MKSYLLLLTLAVSLFCGCQENENLFPDPLNPSQKTFKSSLFVFVKDNTGKPVYNAEVRLGDKKANTDSDGFLYLENIDLGKSSYLTVAKDGFFHASRRFYPSEGVSEYINIVMLSVSRVAFFSATSGGNYVGDGVHIKFPSNAYELENGSKHTGDVFVSAVSIKGDDPDLSGKMPGDLVGIMSDGSNVALASIGMFAVEMRTSSGDLLKLKEGTSAEVVMEVPASFKNLPVSIPMWHFDEIAGIWREEGEAILSNNTYVTSVSHFSFWNCDAPFQLVKWGAEVRYKGADREDPVIHTQVCLTLLNLNTTRCVTTNSDGTVCGLIAANELFLMEIISPCGEVVYSAEIGPFSDTVFMPAVYIDEPRIISITGVGVNCFDEPITNGYAVIKNGFTNFIPFESDGSFEFTAFKCNDQDVTVRVVDTEALKNSPANTYSPDVLIVADTLKACLDLDEYIVLNLEGLSKEIVFTDPEILMDGIYFIRSVTNDSITQNIFFNLDLINTFYTTTNCIINIELPEGKVYSHEMHVEITELGPIGGFVRGNLNGTLYRNENPVYDFTGRFAVMRNK